MWQENRKICNGKLDELLVLVKIPVQKILSILKWMLSQQRNEWEFIGDSGKYEIVRLTGILVIVAKEYV
jgi:hypothetical protein